MPCTKCATPMCHTTQLPRDLWALLRHARIAHRAAVWNFPSDKLQMWDGGQDSTEPS